MHCNALGFKPLIAESSTSYEGASGPQAISKGVPGKNRSIKVWCAAWHKKVRKKKVIEER